MTPIASMVAQMLADGVPHAAIILAVSTAEQVMVAQAVSTRHPPDTQLEKRREWDREYRRRTRPVHPTSTRHPPDPPDNEVAAISILEVKDTKKEKISSRGTKIPPDWKPNESHFENGRQRGHDQARIEVFAEDMRLWANANANRAVARKADWDLTFDGWIRRQPPGATPPQTATPPPKQAREFPKISQDLIEKFAVWWTPAIPESVPPEQWQSFQQELKNGKANSGQAASVVRGGTGIREGQAGFL